MIPAFGIRLAPPEMEEAYRASARFRYEKHTLLLMWLTLIAQAGWVPLDFLFLADGPHRTSVAVIRALAAVGSTVAIVLVHRTKSVSAFEAIVLTWTLVTAGALLIIGSTGTYELAGSMIWHLLTIVAFLALLPVPVLVVLPSTLLLTAGELLIRSGGLSQWGSTQDMVTGVAGLFFAHVVGIVASTEMGMSRRRAFRLWVEDVKDRVALQQALIEVRELRDIIPICMHCKGVRSDEGFWEGVDTYIARKSGSDLSHGICPDCFDEHYADHMD